MDDNNSTPEYRVVDTSKGMADGQDKCPACGAACISPDPSAGTLKCTFCRYEFIPERAIGLDTDLSQLEGKVVGSGTLNIAYDAENILTLECESCGAEVVIDTNESAQARCHWCRNTLSVNRQIPNGSIPDMVLPFNVTKETAQTEINEFVKKRRFFAHPTFKNEFCTENIMGVYLPFMVIGINSRASFKGIGERLVRKYEHDDTTHYDADLYEVEREFDLVIDGLPIVSSADKLDRTSEDRTNNVINAVKPFDVENCVRWNANYLKGFASEKRDTNIDDLKRPVGVKAKDIARHSANETLTEYDRGIIWTKEKLDIKGQQWKAAYLPVWLYSYQQKKSDGNSLLHYVAVNARTKKSMGSVPINKTRLFTVSAIVQLIALIAALLFMFAFEDVWEFGLVSLAAGVTYYAFYYMKYRNKDARFEHEKDVKTSIDNLRKSDVFIEHLTYLTDSKIEGANNMNVDYDIE